MILSNHWLELASKPVELRSTGQPRRLSLRGVPQGPYAMPPPSRCGGLRCRPTLSTACAQRSRPRPERIPQLADGNDALFELLAPDIRVVYIGCGVQREVAAGLVIGAVGLAEATFFFLRNARNLRLVGIESGERLLR